MWKIRYSGLSERPFRQGWAKTGSVALHDFRCGRHALSPGPGAAGDGFAASFLLIGNPRAGFKTYGVPASLSPRARATAGNRHSSQSTRDRMQGQRSRTGVAPDCVREWIERRPLDLVAKVDLSGLAAPLIARGGAWHQVGCGFRLSREREVAGLGTRAIFPMCPHSDGPPDGPA